MTFLNTTQKASSAVSTAEASLTLPLTLADFQHCNMGKYAIFDLDGTLLNSMSVWEDIDTEFLAERGIAKPADYAQEVSWMEFADIATYTIERFGLQETPEAVMAQWREMARVAYATKVSAKPHAHDYVALLAQTGARLAVATSLPEELRDPALKHLGLYSYFSVLNSVTNAGKDKPDVYVQTAAQLGAQPSDCMVFEDLLIGMRSAKQAGMCVCAMYDASSHAQWGEAQRVADYAISDFAQAPVLLA